MNANQERLKLLRLVRHTMLEKREEFTFNMTGLCQIIYDLNRNTAGTTLRAYINRSLNSSGSLEVWLRLQGINCFDLGLPTQDIKSKLFNTRLAWVGHMIKECERIDGN